ncbi:hypothetical protein KV097_01030 [Mumia sp. zg.B17]|nr:hypothetical protein [Mumia sp. zg.B17]MBW9204510.1 hypothetical protein [Mumia sp. zg.B17]
MRRVVSESSSPAVAEELRLSAPNWPDQHGHHPDDVWIATFWTTAYAVAELVRAGRVRADRCVYLVQDWEPSFYPGGDLQLKAAGTYDENFAMLVNSLPLARYVSDQTGRPIDPRYVFAPELDVEPLQRAAANWKPGSEGAVRLLYYARPSKPRNMFALGLQAIRIWAERLPDDVTVHVTLAGEELDGVDLGPRVLADPVGKLTYEQYYEVLAQTDLGLALMSSPHPGHLAIELPMAGIPTVTNPFGDYRDAWFDGLTVSTHPAAGALAAALDIALSEATALRSKGREPGEQRIDLGGKLSDAIDAVCEVFSAGAGKKPAR